MGEHDRAFASCGVQVVLDIAGLVTVSNSFIVLHLLRGAALFCYLKSCC
jgi:hypothetical protein